jgi:hypothetical protein
MHRFATDDTDDDDSVPLEEMEAHGLTLADVRRRYPQAVERTALDGQPCWQTDDLLEEWPAESNAR